MSDDNKSVRSMDDEAAREKMKELEENPPEKLEDWPDDETKYLTFGGGEDESNEPYGEGPTGKLGPPNVRHQEDGSVTVDGEKVDDPSEFKSDEPAKDPLEAAEEEMSQTRESGGD